MTTDTQYIQVVLLQDLQLCDQVYDTANITYELGVQSYNMPQNTSLNDVDCCFHDGKLSISVDYEISNSTDLHIHVKPSEHRIAKKFNNIRTTQRTINYVFNIDFNPTQVLVFLSDSGWLASEQFQNNKYYWS